MADQTHSTSLAVEYLKRVCPTMVEEFTSTPEGMREFQFERVMLETGIFVRRLMREQGIDARKLAEKSGIELRRARRIGKGLGNYLVSDLSAVFCALGVSLRITPGPLDLSSTEGI